ncbi:MAG: hypothetical protein AB1921_19670 [Thermodesulfobacteriota bacterium]
MKALLEIKRRKCRQSGMALLVTIAAVAILIAITVEAHRQVRSELLVSAAKRNEQELSWEARAGLTAAMAMLIEDKRNTKADTLQEPWAQPEERMRMMAEMGLGPEVTVEITDCLSRIQINALVKQNGKDVNEAQQNLWDRFLRPIVSERDDMDLNATTDIINSMKDWLDHDDDDAVTGVNGAETDYYESLDPPYKARNAPITETAEMLFIKGITPDLFSGTADAPGIGPNVTAYGSQILGESKDKLQYPGKINISTAPVAVLKALLPPEDQDLAEAMAAYRDLRESNTFINDITDPGWYKNAPGCSEVNIDPNLVTVTSDQFVIVSRAVRGDSASKITAVVQREKDQQTGKGVCRILTFRLS